MSLPTLSFLITGWTVVFFGVLAVRLVNYHFNKKERALEQSTEVVQEVHEMPTLKEAGFTSPNLFVYKDMAYWIEDGTLYRAKHEDVVHLNTKEAVDPLARQGLELEEYMQILGTVEAMND